MYEHEHEQQQELTKKQSLLGWMKIHGVDSRTLIQVDDNSRWQALGLGEVEWDESPEMPPPS